MFILTTEEFQRVLQCGALLSYVARFSAFLAARNVLFAKGAGMLPILLTLVLLVF